MHKRRLGKTNLEVSILSLGGAAFGDMYGTLQMGEADACVRLAIDSGINLIDTSPYYGLTRSESVLGEILSAGLRQKILLCSKAGRNGTKEFDFSASAMQRSVDASLKRLHTDYLDILIAHDIEFAQDREMVFTETAEVLHRLKQAGKCRFIGMSGYPLPVLKQAIERCQLDVVISYCHFNLQNQLLLDELLPIAQKHDVGMLNASPLAMGLLTHQGPPPWHPASEDLKQTCQKAARFCQAQQADLSVLGMQFCFTESRVPSTITGTARTEELKRNLQALQTPMDLTLLKEVQTILEPIHNQTWPSGH